MAVLGMLNWIKENTILMEELKPCPFCGATDDEIQFYNYFLPYAPKIGVPVINLIYCTKCGGALIDQNKNHCYNDRVAMWNRRANERT